ncbi:MAG: hypothetical protein K2L45_06905 [Muribaculaceae bacterium]|nr:hypothetical protein [Muribaculaceae bacterium]
MEISGISFYDFLGKLIPGSLLWTPWILKSYNGNFEGIEFASFTCLLYFILFIGFYLIGIIWDFIIVRKIFHCLRLNPTMLILSKERYNKDSSAEITHSDTSDPDTIKKIYIAAYYKGLEEGALHDLPIMESHENFLKTIWLLIGYYVVWAGYYLPETWNVVVMSILILFFILVPIIWYRTQMKIYYTVWEAEDNI